MKKTTLIVSFFIIFIIILAPLVGNSFMQKIVDENVQSLQNNGLVLKNMKNDSTYLNTKKHFEFVLQNAEIFTHYIHSYTKTKIPSYFNKILNGATIAVDVEYSNIPFSKAITLEVYPLSLSHSLMQEMKINNSEAYQHFVHFLTSKGLLYSVEYNLVSQDFDGYVKDIDEFYNFKDGKKLLMQLENVRFSGHGDVLEPQDSKFSLDRLKFDVNDGKNSFLIDVNTVRNSNDFQSFANYASSTKVFHTEFSFQSPQDDINVSIENFDVSSSAKQKNEKVDLHSKSLIGNVVFHTKKMDYTLENFNSDISVTALDKQSFENFSSLLTQSKSMNKAVLQQKMQKSLLSLLSHGLHVKVSEISLQNITLNKIQTLGGMKITSDLQIKADKELANKLQISPMLLLENIKMQIDIRLANALYLKLIEDSPLAPTIASYAKKDADSIYFDIHFEDAKLMINDKTVQ
ncbi:hypothetical protein [Sulfurimonas sp.]